ncbi:pyridoxal-5'-phosphate-dependent protein subunit beta [Halobacteriales archaeon QS_4_62_28]|nr:MAG: pyridoxal-5'-phosphate-dependent protein subunit beta [Halobacteriales archaeon QS_4_62_28]
METTSGFREFECTACTATFDAERVETRCPSCAAVLVARYDLSVDGDKDRPAAPPLPVPGDALVSINEGETPATDCETLAEEIGIDRLRIKDEGRNPTGAVTDRGIAVAISAATQRGADDVALPTTGNGGQSAAAYAGRAGLGSHSYVPARCPFVNKAMINVHGGDMNVVEGRYPDALDAYESGHEDGWAAIGPASPYRREGLKGLYYELVGDGSPVPDAIVVPAGHGIVVAAIHSAIEELQAADVVAETPRLYAVQPTGCAPIATACETGSDIESESQPDTIVGPLEVPDPAVGTLAVDAVEATGGTGVTVSDEDALQAAVDAASTTGIEMSATGGVALAGVRERTDEFDSMENVVVVNPVAGSKEDDLLRSHLMSQGL